MKKLTLAALLSGLGVPAWANYAGLRCTASGDPVLVRAEGVAEPVGTIVMNCSPIGVTTGTVMASISITMGTPLGNRVTAEGLIDATLEVDKGFGIGPSGSRARAIGTNGAVFEPVTFPLPSHGQVAFRISNLRASSGESENQLLAFIQLNGGSSMAVVNNPVRVGVAKRALAAAGVPARIECKAAPAPQNPSFSALMTAGVKATTIRVTETSIGAFDFQQLGTTNGTRVVVKYENFPAGSHVYVPNVITGSTQASATSVGDFGLPASGGQIAPGASGLLLARVPLADSNGSGGTPLIAPGTFFTDVAITTEDMFEVPVSNGTASVTYEVVNANPNVVEFAHIPTFVCVPPGDAEGRIAVATVSLGPVSVQNGASATAPVPRFAAVLPSPDCHLLNDCDLVFVPKLSVVTPQLSFKMTPGATTGPSAEIQVRNSGQGTLSWIAKVAYPEEAKVKDWLRLSAVSGTGDGKIALQVLADGLVEGTHEAVLSIEAGNGGSQSLPVIVEVGASSVEGPRANRPRLTSAGSAADAGIPLVPGSLGTLHGSGLRGPAQVSFDGMAARIFSQEEDRINFVVPEPLLARDKAQMTVTVAGERVDTRAVTISRMAPAIFAAGVFNQDWRAHSEAAPEKAGNVLQIFATGLPLREAGVIIARIHDREITLPVFAGEAPGLPGIQQVNVRIPDDLRPMDTNLWLCGIPTTDPVGRVCSLPVRIRISH